MKEIASDIVKLVKITWAYTWRSGVYYLIFAFPLFLAGFLIVSIFNDSVIAQYLQNINNFFTLKESSYFQFILQRIILIFIAAPFEFIAFREVMKIQFSDFSLFATPIGKRTDKSALKSSVRHTPILRFWFAWWGCSNLIIILTSNLLYQFSASPYYNLFLIFWLIGVDVIILKILLQRTFSDFRMVLIPSSQDSERKNP